MALRRVLSALPQFSRLNSTFFLSETSLCSCGSIRGVSSTTSVGDQQKKNKNVEKNAEKIGLENGVGAPYLPWTATRMLVKKKTYFKRMGYLLQVLDKEKVDEYKSQKNFPNFNPGDIIEAKIKVPENFNKEETIRGVCIAKKNRGLGSSFTLRKTWSNPAVGLERTIPLYSPQLLEIKVVGRRRVRRAKLYYMRNRLQETNV